MKLSQGHEPLWSRGCGKNSEGIHTVLWESGDPSVSPETALQFLGLPSTPGSRRLHSGGFRSLLFWKGLDSSEPLSLSVRCDRNSCTS